MLKPGDIYWAEIPAGQRRPVVVVSAARFNHGRYVTIVPFTSREFERRQALPNCVPFLKGEFGLTVACVAQAENLAKIEVELLDLGAGPVGILDDERLRVLVRAIGCVIDAECERV